MSFENERFLDRDSDDNVELENSVGDEVSREDDNWREKALAGREVQTFDSQMKLEGRDRDEFLSALEGKGGKGR
jgi:hypothetical protein